MTIIFHMISLILGIEGSPLGTNDTSLVLQAAAPRPGRDLAGEVQALLATKCTECHGAHLARPKGNFGNVADLKQLTANPKLVVPLRPGESKLWVLIEAGKMPPQRARAGPLTEPQKDLVRAWIQAGAPTTARGPAPGAFLAATAATEGGAPEGSGGSLAERLLGWLGRFHVLVIHFPIALLIAAAAGELWSLWRGLRQPAPAVRFCVLVGTAGAVAGAVLGWFHAGLGGFAGDSSQMLTLHRWLGTAAGALAIGVASLSEDDARCGVRSRLFRVVLFAEALLVGVVGHLGGTVVYGEGYFNW